jgi:hypothetical protein
MTFGLYILLYFRVLKRLLDFMERTTTPRKRSHL